MPNRVGESTVRSHTEYAHTRFRCRRCGATVPEEGIDGVLCVNCRTSVESS